MKKQHKSVQIRQGDVLIVKSRIPKGAKEVQRDNGAVVLAYGEVTGHSHHITDAGATLLEHEGRRFLRVDGSATIRHQEHDALKVSESESEIIQQCEWTSEGIEAVRD